MKDCTQVSAAIITQNQRVLITQRDSEDEMGEKWEFPGGKVKPGESPQQCLRRELHEELGVIADIHDLFAVSKHVYPQLSVELRVYKASIRSGQITLHVHQAYRWVSVDALETFDFLEADAPILRKLRNESAY